MPTGYCDIHLPEMNAFYFSNNGRYKQDLHITYMFRVQQITPTFLSIISFRFRQLNYSVSGRSVHMDSHYHVEILGDILIVRFTETPGHSDIIDAINSVSNNEEPLRLWNMSAGTDLTENELYSIIQHEKLTLKDPEKFALVASDNLSFGLSRMYMAYRAHDDLEQDVFRSEKEALDWLRT